MDRERVRRDVLRLLPGVERAPEQPFPGGADDRELTAEVAWRPVTTEFAARVLALLHDPRRA